MKIEIASVDSIVIYFSDIVSKETHEQIKQTFQHLKALNNPSLIELVPSYTTLFITYDIFQYNFEDFKKYLEMELKNITPCLEKSTELIHIDVYYGIEVGLDLERVSKQSQLSIQEVIQKHSEQTYDVYAIGFLPGFAYLGEVHESIHTPRLDSPRKVIPKGSVAIANNQTAVYPIDSPGGWNILGRTTFEFIDKSHKDLSEINIQSKIKFNPISKSHFLEQGGQLWMD